MNLMVAVVVVAVVAVAPAGAQSAIVFDPPEPTVEDQIRFATSSEGPWTWDFGDGTSNATQPLATHLYPHAGIYTVTLQAANATHEIEIAVRLPPSAYADIDEATYLGRLNGTEAGHNETLAASKEARSGFDPWSSTWTWTLVVLVGIGLPGLGVVWWKRRMDDRAALRFEDEDEAFMDEMPPDSYAEHEAPAIEDLEALLPLDDDMPDDSTGDEESNAPAPASLLLGVEDEPEGEPHRHEQAHDEDDLDEGAILAGLRLEGEP